MHALTVRRAYQTAFTLYVLIVLVVLTSVPGSITVDYGADAATWLLPAQGLVEAGGFVHPDSPHRPMTERPPLYPGLVAATIYLAGDNFPKLLVLIQAAVFACSAMMLARWAERLGPPDRPMIGPLAFALFLFNPNSLGTVFFLQSETIFAAFVLAATIALHHTAMQPGFRRAAGLGLLLAACVLIRPEGQFLAILAVVGLPLISLLGGARVPLRRVLLSSAVLAVVCFMSVSPWMARTASLGEGFRVTGAANTVYYLWGSGTQLEMVATGVGGAEAEARMQARQRAVAAAFGESWYVMPELEQQRHLRDAAIAQIFSYSPSVIFKTTALATLQFFSAGGGGRLFALAGQPDASPFAQMQASGESSYAESVLLAVSEADMSLLGLWGAAMGFVMVTRILGLIGAARILLRRRWDIALLIATVILFFALVMPFYGISRFRVPAEFAFVLLTCFSLFPPRRGNAITVQQTSC